MAITDIYSKRQRRLRGELPEVFVYDPIPAPLRIQITQILNEAIGTVGPSEFRYHANNQAVSAVYRRIEKLLLREYGKDFLFDHRSSDPIKQVHQFIRNTPLTEHFLDALELLFRDIRDVASDSSYRSNAITISISPEEAIEELNNRFKEHGIGYQFVAGEIIRLDSTYTHSEIVLETLNLISNKQFAGANQEYLKAHEHYRHGRNHECLNECLKAFESTMKIICDHKGWVYQQNDTASKLIKICLENNLIPTTLDSQLGGLQNLLMTGVPAIRNKNSGHGAGATTITVSNELTRYMLNLTGSNIILLVESSGL